MQSNGRHSSTSVKTHNKLRFFLSLFLCFIAFNLLHADNGKSLPIVCTQINALHLFAGGFNDISRLLGFGSVFSNAASHSSPKVSVVTWLASARKKTFQLKKQNQTPAVTAPNHVSAHQKIIKKIKESVTRCFIICIPCQLALHSQVYFSCF